MTFPEFIADKRIHAAAAEFTAVFGGSFFCEEPGDALVYEPPDGDARTPPEGATADTVLKTLRESMEKHRNVILERWNMPEYDPDALY